MTPFHIPLGISCLEVSEYISAEEKRILEILELIVLERLNIDAPVDVLSRSLNYRIWVKDERVPYDARNKNDKFEDLVNLSKYYPQCESYFSETICVNAATVWRWSTGKTRPSKLLGERLVNEIRCILISCVADDVDLLSIRYDASQEDRVLAHTCRDQFKYIIPHSMKLVSQKKINSKQ